MGRAAVSALIGNNEAYPSTRQLQDARNAERIRIDSHATVETDQRHAVANIRIGESHAIDRYMCTTNLFAGLVHVSGAVRRRLSCVATASLRRLEPKSLSIARREIAPDDSRRSKSASAFLVS